MERGLTFCRTCHVALAAEGEALHVYVRPHRNVRGSELDLLPGVLPFHLLASRRDVKCTVAGSAY